MLSEERMQELAEQFEERFSRVCLRILQDIGETLKKTGDLTPSQAKKLQQMFTYGADVEEMTKQLARAAGTSMEDIQKLYEQAAKEEQDWSKPFYDAKGVTQIPFAENELLQNIVKAAAAVTKGELRNMSRTTTVGIRTKNGFQPLGSFYKKTVDEAISAVATGTMDYNSTVRQAIKDMGSSGLRVQYESGYTRRLDSAIRQNIIDGVNYIAQETARQAGEEFGADGVELSAHSPCAPDHLPYQGKQYSLKEYDELQASLKRPIGEWNCRHFPYPILLGISRPANSRAELAEMERESNRKIEIDGKEYTRYECTQLQRKLETNLRYAREEKAIYQAAGQADLVREATEKIRILGNKYKEVSEKAGLPTRAERMRVLAARQQKQHMEIESHRKEDYDNIEKTVVDEKIFKNEKWKNNFTKLTENEKVNRSILNISEQILKDRSGTFYESMYFINAKAGKIEGFNTEDNIRLGVGLNNSLKSVLRRMDIEVIGVHNHPYSGIPSFGDLNAIAGRSNQTMGVIICHDGTLFTYTKPLAEISEQDYNIALTRYKKFSNITRETKGMNDLAFDYGFEFRRIEYEE